MLNDEENIALNAENYLIQSFTFCMSKVICFRVTDLVFMLSVGYFRNNKFSNINTQTVKLFT